MSSLLTPDARETQEPMTMVCWTSKTTSWYLSPSPVGNATQHNKQIKECADFPQGGPGVPLSHGLFLDHTLNTFTFILTPKVIHSPIDEKISIQPYIQYIFQYTVALYIFICHTWLTLAQHLANRCPTLAPHLPIHDQ